jgi:tetratricopeptide (TPR) repeat protein
MNPREADAKSLASPAQVEGVSFIQVPDHELLRQIGTGSYGEVWLARNALGSYRAVKIVYRKRFAHERPFEREFSGIQKFEPISRSQEGLVHVLQVGRNNGAGYFYYVMELADDGNVGQASRLSSPTNASAGEQTGGTPVLLYEPKTLASEIRARGRLPFDECLRIGLTLTSALAHLHKNGLVHRDIKPSNIIFVNGAPKLADIGLVTDAADAPSYVGTEGFIPPEGPGTLQADIYSLGKVLYEIATGKDRHDYPELPTKLDDTVNQAELIELNEIILTACRADPRQRYQSSEQMHADLVLLQGGRSIKQLHKLEKRLALATRIGIGAAAAALLAVGGYVGSVKQIQRARRAETLAAANAAKAGSEAAKSQRVAQVLKDTLQDLGPSVALGRDPTMVREILDRAANRINRDFANQPEIAIELWTTLAATYGELGLHDKMEEMARKNLELARSTLGEENLAVANALSQLGEALLFRDKPEQAETLTREALRIRRKLLGNEHLDVAQSLGSLGDILHGRAKPEEVEAVFREGLTICAKLGQKTLVEADLLDGLAVELRNGRLEEAEAASRRSLEIKRTLLGNEHPSVAGALDVLAMVLKEEGMALEDQGKLAEAETLHRELVEMNQKLFGEDHYTVAGALGGLGSTLTEQGRLVEAESVLRETVAIQRKARVDDRFGFTWTLHYLGLALERQGKLAEAENTYREILMIRQKLSANPRGQLLMALAGVLRKQGKRSEADALLPSTVDAFRKQADLGELDAQNAIAWLLATHPEPAVRDGGEAVTYAEQAVAATRRANPEYLDTLAAAHAEAGDFAKAVAVQKEAMALLHTEEEKRGYASRLKLYESGSPYRERQ